MVTTKKIWKRPLFKKKATRKRVYKSKSKFSAKKKYPLKRKFSSKRVNLRAPRAPSRRHHKPRYAHGGHRYARPTKPSINGITTLSRARVCNLKYELPEYAMSTGLGVSVKTFRANSIYDPENTAGAGQESVRGWSEVNAIFERYDVFQAYATFKFSWGGSIPGGSAGVICSVTANDTTGAPSDIDDRYAISNHAILRPEYDACVVLKSAIRSRDWWPYGKGDTSFLASVMANNPTFQVYFNLATQNVAGAAITNPVIVETTIVYKTRIFEPRFIVQPGPTELIYDPDMPVPEPIDPDLVECIDPGTPGLDTIAEDFEMVTVQVPRRSLSQPR